MGRCYRYQEKFYFNPGDTGFKVFSTKYAVIGVAICWDQWFPEAARAMALQGAEVQSTHLPPLKYAISLVTT
jgi:predicted amidohydrolase